MNSSANHDSGKRKCPICESFYDPKESKSLPFCSSRCKQIDLGRWLDEDYSVPHERSEDEFDDYGADFYG